MESITLVTVPRSFIKEAQCQAPGSKSSSSLIGKRSEVQPSPANSPPKSPAMATPPSVGVKFVSAGLAACWGDIVTFPLDTAKVRLQVQGEASGVATAVAQQFKYRGVFGTLLTMCKEEGPRAMYNGLVPGLQRQMCFASVRIGLYDSVKQMYVDFFQANGLVSGQNFGLRLLAGVTTGGLAVVCAQPTDVVKVRMQAHKAGTPKRYSGALDAYRKIAKHEGLKGLWKGSLPNMTRNAVVNCSELVSYDLIKEAILRHKLLPDTLPCHFTSAIGAGFITTVIASPVDVVKTRYMNSGKGIYKGALHCATSMYREGGITAFYKGFVPSFLRLGSWNIVMFVTFEQLKRVFSQYQSPSQPQLPKVTLNADNGKVHV